MVYFERTAGDNLELAITSGHRTLGVNEDDWELLQDGVLGWTVESVFTPPAPQFGGRIATDLSAEMFERANSAYLRVPFEVPGQADFERLQLQMQYDDAFVAYLNGQEVARAGITGVPNWNSVADSDRPDEQATIWQAFDITSQLGLLQAGSNVLAIQGLNADTASNGFLLAARLDAVTLPPPELGFLSMPTRGAANGTTANSVLLPPTFSRPGGTFAAPIEVLLQHHLPHTEIRYTTDGSLPGLHSTLYEGPLQLENSTEVRARAFALNHVASEVVSQYYSFIAGETFAFDVEGRSLANFESELPILVIDTFLQPVTSSGFHPAAVVLHEPDDTGHTDLVGPADVVSRAGIRIRGSSSAANAKRPYALELRNDGDDFDRDLSLAGLPAESDWVLLGPYALDRSLTRDALVYDLSNQFGRYAPRTQYVEVFLNRDDFRVTSADYEGVYVLLEKLKSGPDRIDIEPAPPHATTEPEISGGYIFKIDRTDPGDDGFLVELGPQDIEEPLTQRILYVDPKEAEIEVRPDQPAERPEQAAFVQQFFNELNAAVYAPGFTHPDYGHYDNYIDVAAWIDNQIINDFPWNTSFPTLSAYFHLPREGKLRAGPAWDFDRSQEPADSRTDNDNPDTWGPSRLLLWWGRLFEDPDFHQAWVDRWVELRRDQLSEENLLGSLDRLANQIATAQARNFNRWPNVSPRSSSGFDSGALDGTWEGEVAHQKQWLLGRLAWFDSQHVLPPVWRQTDPAAPIVLSGPASALWYYTTDGSDPRLPGGRIAPQAQIYSGPIDPAGVTTLVARAYEPNFESTFVPSNVPWSGPATLVTPAASPLHGLRISEVQYHPAPATAAEALAGFADESAFEYIELVNIADATLDLRQVELIQTAVGGSQQGVAFDFGSGAVTHVQAGERVLVVRDMSAFAARYGEGLPVAGAWSGGLSNNREQLTLVWDGAEIQHFSYDDNWHSATDGSGPALELIDPRHPDLTSWGQAASWQPSQDSQGTPGVARVRGDFTADDVVDAADIDVLSAALRAGRQDRVFDLLGDGQVDNRDRSELVDNVLQTRLGDTNLDRAVNMDDGATLLMHLGTAGGWAQGDFDGDGWITGSVDGALLLAGLTADTAQALAQQVAEDLAGRLARGI